MAGEAEDNIILPGGQETNQTPSAAPKDDAGGKPAGAEDDAKAAAAKEAEDKAKAEDEAKAAAEAEGETEEDEQEHNDDWKEQYIDIPDEGARSVINLLKEANVSPVEANAIFEEALKTDDLSKIKWDVLESRLGKDKANLAKIGITDYYNREYSKNVATTNMAHEIVGGKENWSKVAAWVRRTEKADGKRKGEFDELRRGIDLGGRYAKQALNDLKALYEADTKNSGLGVAKITEGTTPSKSGLEPMTRAQYVAELAKEGDRIAPAKYEELRSRRRAGMQAGI